MDSGQRGEHPADCGEARGRIAAAFLVPPSPLSPILGMSGKGRPPAMANAEHLEIVKRGPRAIAAWRERHPEVRLDLEDADLEDADLAGANLQNTSLAGANLAGANLLEADLSGANLRGANLTGADRRGADLEGAEFEEPPTEPWAHAGS